MENKVIRKSVSVVVIAAMVMSIFSFSILFKTDKSYASTDAVVKVKSTNNEGSIAPFVAADPAYNANASLNKHSFTSVIKPNKWNPIWADGHRYSRISNLYDTYGNDGTKYVQGEEFFMPASINVKGKQLDRTFTYSLYEISLSSYTRFGVELFSTNAGKYTITTQFMKCYVSVQTVGSSKYAYFKRAD